MISDSFPRPGHVLFNAKPPVDFTLRSLSTALGKNIDERERPLAKSNPRLVAQCTLILYLARRDYFLDVVLKKLFMLAALAQKHVSYHVSHELTL